MPGATAALYEPLIERDLAAIPAAVARFRRDHSTHDLFLAVARFALLAYAPSSHSRHALLACLSAWDTQGEAGPRFDELLVECARYAAQSRRPWSEPPLLDPPAVESSARPERTALFEAIAAADLRSAENWLAATCEDDAVAGDLLDAACRFPGELGHSVIVTNAVLRLAELLGAKGRYAVLRVAVWELLAAKGLASQPLPGRIEDPEKILTSLIGRAVESGGTIETLHGVFLFDAARQAGVLDRVLPLFGNLEAREVHERTPSTPPALPVYPLARDYGACLKAHAVAGRLDHPGMAAFLEAAHRNLLEGESFEDWILA